MDHCGFGARGGPSNPDAWTVGCSFAEPRRYSTGQLACLVAPTAQSATPLARRILSKRGPTDDDRTKDSFAIAGPWVGLFVGMEALGSFDPLDDRIGCGPVCPASRLRGGSDRSAGSSSVLLGSVWDGFGLEDLLDERSSDGSDANCTINAIQLDN